MLLMCAGTRLGNLSSLWERGRRCASCALSSRASGVVLLRTTGEKTFPVICLAALAASVKDWTTWREGLDRNAFSDYGLRILQTPVSEYPVLS